MPRIAMDFRRWNDPVSAFYHAGTFLNPSECSSRRCVSETQRTPFCGKSHNAGFRRSRANILHGGLAAMGKGRDGLGKFGAIRRQRSAGSAFSNLFTEKFTSLLLK